MIGRTLSHYRITAALGAGGMGEVYRATDTKLHRDVAIKVLPAEVAQDTERLARFEREAQLLASLNHPNIAAIHGLEEVDGRLFLVLELVEGEGLNERLERGAVPVEDAIELGRQIAEGLETAHENGIMHRDLKPANVKITPDGKVKVLDFGLAKAWIGDAVTGSSRDLSQSPTLANTGTQAGVILGTAAYMSPEQARGRLVDRRADVWAFGAVLWEMLTGRQLFGGDTVSDIVAAVLTREPDWSKLPAGTPPSVRQLLRRTLERDPRRRLRDIGEARVVLEEPGPDAADAGEAPKGSRRRRSLIAAGVVAGGLALAVGWLLGSSSSPRDPPVRKVDLWLTDFDAPLGRTPVISPDGARVAYAAGGRLHVREIDRFDSVELPGTEGFQYPSWSPDSRQLAFVSKGRAWKVAIDGGPSTELGEVPEDLLGSGGSVWTRDGRIVISGSNDVGLWEIPSEGGQGREILSTDPETLLDFHELALLPEDQGILVVIHRLAPDTVAVLADGALRVVLQIPGERLRYPAYAPTGHLVYERETTNPGIWAVPFSLERLETTGAPLLVVPDGSAPSVAQDGTLSFVRPDDSPLELVRVSRDGVVRSVAVLPGTSPADYGSANAGSGFRLGVGLALSPDGGRVAFMLGDTTAGQLWVYDLVRESLAVLSTRVWALGRPVWTLGGQDVVFAGGRDDALLWNLSSRRSDAAGEEIQLAPRDNVFRSPLAVSPDGRWLVFTKDFSPSQTLLSRMPLDGSSDETPLFGSVDSSLGASFSPDGRWLAYEAFESGRTEVYARRFSGGEGRFRLSTNGGYAPVWHEDEVVYIGDGGVSAVSVTAGSDSLAVSKPTFLFQTGSENRLLPAFDVMPDGDFVMLRSSGRRRLSLVLNWPQELARLGTEGTSEQR